MRPVFDPSAVHHLKHTGAVDADGHVLEDAGLWEQLRLLDAEGLDAAVLYPTLGILWEAELDDMELSQAYCRAYNRWIADFCRGSRGRLIPIAHLSLGDPAAAAAELERAVKEGCRGAFVVPFTWTGGRAPLAMKPSDYFRRQVWISGDPDERTLPAIMTTYGADRFFWASDYPHPDHTGDYLQALDEMVDEVAPPQRAGLLGGNVRRAFGF